MNFIRFGKHIYKSSKEVISIYTIEEYVNDLITRVGVLETQAGISHSDDASEGTIPLPAGPGTPFQIFADNINVDIDPNTMPFPIDMEYPANSGRHLICDKNASMIWGWYYIGEVNSNY